MRTAKTLWQNRKEKKEWRRLQSEDRVWRYSIRMRRALMVGGLVEKLRREHRSTAIDRGVLDSSIRHFGRTGFEVYLVNARHTKNLPGRKSDGQESQWLLKLHTYGLLNNSFYPPSAIRTLRTYWRQRAEHVEGAATCILRMQKALTQMNLQLANVISDLSGVTGQKIVRAIVAGERDPRKLAELRDARIQASQEEPRAWKVIGVPNSCLC
jgi:hypothetical protein